MNVGGTTISVPPTFTIQLPMMVEDFTGRP
jgi:hypothetical protein